MESLNVTDLPTNGDKFVPKLSDISPIPSLVELCSRYVARNIYGCETLQGIPEQIQRHIYSMVKPRIIIDDKFVTLFRDVHVTKLDGHFTREAIKEIAKSYKMENDGIVKDEKKKVYNAELKKEKSSKRYKNTQVKIAPVSNPWGSPSSFSSRFDQLRIDDDVFITPDEVDTDDNNNNNTNNSDNNNNDNNTDVVDNFAIEFSEIFEPIIKDEEFPPLNPRAPIKLRNSSQTIPASAEEFIRNSQILRNSKLLSTNNGLSSSLYTDDDDDVIYITDDTQIIETKPSIIPCFPHLTSICLKRAVDCRNIGFVLQQIEGLKSLHINYKKINSHARETSHNDLVQDIPFIMRMSQLEELTLEGVPLDARAFKCIKKVELNNLKTLSLRFCHRLPNNSDLSKLFVPSLTKLDLSRTLR